ncbi:unnamed protein product [Caenorhabditis brenneri]
MIPINRTPKFPHLCGQKTTLLSFLRKLLDSGTHDNIICWVDKSTLHFKIVDSDALAQLWGAQKSRTVPMTYEKMERSFRDFRHKDKTMEQIRGSKYEYRFLESSSSSIAPVTPRSSPLLTPTITRPFTIENILATDAPGCRFTSKSPKGSSLPNSPTFSGSSSAGSSIQGSPTNQAFVQSSVQLAQQNAIRFHMFIAQFPNLQLLPINEQINRFFRMGQAAGAQTYNSQK